MHLRTIIKIIIFLIAVIVLTFALFYYKEILLAPSLSSEINKVCFTSNCFFVDIAKTEQGRERGLMSKTSLDKDRGMLFIFDKEGMYPFWMKNTLIPLDMIWISKDYQVVYIADSVRPCGQENCPVINPSVNAKYVLEVNGDISKEIGLKLGNKALFIK